MRGGFVEQGRLFSYISPEARVARTFAARREPRSSLRTAGYFGLGCAL
jgi:hypothetical protein